MFSRPCSAVPTAGNRGFFHGIYFNCGEPGHKSIDCQYSQQWSWYGDGKHDWAWRNQWWGGEAWCSVNFEIWNNQDEGLKVNLARKLRAEVRGRAVLDCGATRCVAGVQALDDLQQWAQCRSTALGSSRPVSRRRPLPRHHLTVTDHPESPGVLVLADLLDYADG